jgi:tetratricopeptide (TPR) repeat protein
LTVGLSQQKSYITEKNVWFDLEVRVVDKDTKQPIKNAAVSVNGRQFRYDIIKDFYLVKAQVGQQLTVTHLGFESVYYIIESNEEIKIEVEDFDNIRNRGVKSKKTSRSDAYGVMSRFSNETDSYNQNLDSAIFYKEKNIEKSLSFIEEILKRNQSRGRNAATYKLLGDVYNQWKQYDLAIANYKNSLQYREDESIKLVLAQAAINIQKYEEAEKYLKDIRIKKLGFFEKILVYESLGDIYFETEEFSKSTNNYKKALNIAEDNEITSKVTDLNSKLGDVLVAQGKIDKANLQFQNTLELAKKESPIRSIAEKEKVANYYNSTQQLDKEIELRKETLEETKTVPISIENTNYNFSDFDISATKKFSPSPSQLESTFKPSAKTISDTLNSEVKFNLTVPQEEKSRRGYNAVNSQSINYKIGRALVQKEDYEKAIPFLKKSIEDAEESDDLVIKKDATKKLSEVYDNVGDYDKAFVTYRAYVNLVDTLYVRKQQEIEQAKRFAQIIADNRNRITSLEKDKELNESKVNLAVKDQELSDARNKSQQYIIYTLLFGIAAMVVFAYLLFRSNKQQKLANNLLALKSMRSQMNPHFIFNALNSVNSFIAVNDERNANRYLSEFSVLMRSVLENSDEDFIPFSKEIELIELYVKLEHNRFKEKFDYEIIVDKSIDLDEYSIPPMLLQPYIENAIWHGLRYKQEKGTLQVLIESRGQEKLAVIVQDNGVGRKRSQELKTKNQLKQKSKGMSTIKKRISILNDMYQDRISVSVSDLLEDGTGTKVELLLKRN